MRKRQRNKNFKKSLKEMTASEGYKRMMLDLKGLKTPTAKEASEMLTRAILVDVEALSNLGITYEH